MHLSSCLNISTAILIYFIGVSIIITCNGQTNDSSLVSHLGNNANSIVIEIGKNPLDIFSTGIPDISAKQLKKFTLSRRRRRRKHRNNKRRKGVATSTKRLITIADGLVSKNGTKTAEKKKKRRRRKFKKRINNKSIQTNMPDASLKIVEKKLLPASSLGIFLGELVGPIPTFLNGSKSSTVVSNSNKQHEKNNIEKNYRCRKHTCAHICHAEGPIKCSCLEGFYLAKNGKSCIDINECKTSNGGCEYQCINTLGSYECRCPKGLRLSDDLKTCEDINECLLRNGHGPCQDTCKNTFGHYECSCEGLKGTRLAPDRFACEHIDNCAKNNGGCSHNCIDTLRGAFCGCPPGMVLTDDWKTCQDIDECEDESITTTCENGCYNTIGSYHCLSNEINET